MFRGLDPTNSCLESLFQLHLLKHFDAAKLLPKLGCVSTGRPQFSVLSWPIITVKLEYEDANP